VTSLNYTLLNDETDMETNLLKRSLDVNSPTPLYYQLKHLIIESMNSGELQPGSNIPSEHTLAKTYNISRSTIRRAMADLEHEGYIHRQRGRPSTVRARPVYHGATTVAGFGDDMRSQGYKPWSKVLGVNIELADAQLAAKLRINEGAEVISAYRLRLADGKPVCTERPHLPFARVGAISPKDIEGEKSLYNHLRRNLGIHPYTVEEILEVAFADDKTATLLEISPNSPVVQLQRTVFTETGECIEYALSLWRIDRFRYIARRVGSGHIAVQKSQSDEL
jgi:GntR family transcriptional regulator